MATMQAENLEGVPAKLLRELRGPLLRDNAVIWRGERNSYRNLYRQAQRKAARLESELAKARKACRRMREDLERIG